MSAHTTQKYYLVNLSTRNVSVSTHLRSDNYILKAGKCIYLGFLTDELILKYNKYSALNINLRIVTKDKLVSILNRSINLNEEQIKAILNDDVVRTPHDAGSISDTVYTSIPNKEEKQQSLIESVSKASSSLFTQPLPTKNSTVKKNNDVESVNSNSVDNPVSSGEVIESTDANELNKSNISEQSSNDNNLFEDKNNTEYVVNEIDVVKENAKQDLKNMSYNQLYELAKEKNLLSGKGRPGRAKLIDMISESV